MGRDYIDQWTIGHFIGGIAFRVAVFPNTPILSFTLSVFIHLFTELLEVDPHPVTGQRESPENHMGDMMVFILGWFVGGLVEPYIPSYGDGYLRYIILFFVILISITEILREIPPYVGAKVM